MIEMLTVTGWALALGGVAAAALARWRIASLAEEVARASHELRGPLTAVRLGLELALHSDQPRRAHVRAIELELGRAALALEDLDRARDARVRARCGPGLRLRRRIGSGIPDAVMEDQQLVDVVRLLADSVEAWQGTATALGLTLRLLEPTSRPIVLGNRLRLAQATGNLIANALEHGGVAVEVSSRTDGATVRIEVADRGAGLPAPVTELAHSRRIHRRTGTTRGHGLAIADAVACAHGGRLAAAPSEQGARLVLELPLASGGSRTPHPQLAG